MLRDGDATRNDRVDDRCWSQTIFDLEHIVTTLNVELFNDSRVSAALEINRHLNNRCSNDIYVTIGCHWVKEPTGREYETD